MPLTPLSISKQSEQALLTLCEQPPAQLGEAYARLAARKENIISPKVLRSVLEQPLAAGVVRALVEQLVALRAYIDHAHTSISEAVGALSLGIKEKKWPDDTNKKWENIAPIFEKFLGLENIGTTTKAILLSYDFEHTISSVNILTDIRPVYSVNRDKIIGGIICNRMRIKYRDEDGDKSLSISIDKDEIEQLKMACIEGLKKIELASSLLNTAGKLPSFVTGEESNDGN
jgi:hypothetical protein